MKKIKLFIFVILIIVGIITIALVINPSISVGYNVGLFRNEFSDASFEGRCGLVIKKTKYNVEKDVKLNFSYGYYKEEDLKDFYCVAYLDDQKAGKVYLFNNYIDDFYTLDYKCYKPGLFGSQLKYNHYEEINTNFSDYTKGSIIIELYCLDSHDQELVIEKKISYEVANGKVMFSK